MRSIWTSRISWLSTGRESVESKALSPLPNGRFVIGQHLLCELQIRLRTARSLVIVHDWFAIARGFGETNVSWNACVKNEAGVKTPKIGRHCGREIDAFIEHRKQQPFDL